NLQIISALIYLQADYISDATTLDALKDAQKRIMSMALLHEKLYRSNDLLHLNIAEYVSNLAAHLSTIYKTEARNITITTDVKVGDLDIDTAIPCGLIISEAVSNSLKYAFPGGRSGTIAIVMHERNHCITIRVSDDGIGLPAGMDPRTTPSLGMHLIHMLAENQLDGTLSISSGKGVVYAVQFTRKKA
ncbi:MAG: hypothetical protein GKC04_01625, partial [Methanomicrobiales archaeon]|nr:hypothetical protein [Methanomicrobiales archaeon]